MIIEIAYALLAVALIIFVIYLTITVKNLGEKAGKMLDETENTIKVLTSDVNDRCRPDTRTCNSIC